MRTSVFHAILHLEDEVWVADCPEVGTVSQGATVEEALANLREATELYLEVFQPERLNDRYVVHFEARDNA